MAQAPATGSWDHLQKMPRYAIYLLLAGVVLWQLLAPIRFPIVPSSTTRDVYKAIRAVPENKLIIISVDWDASTQAETGPQTAAVIRACFESGKRFALMNWSTPMGAKLANDIAQPIAEQYHATYGVDWCNWGFKFGGANVLMAMVKNIPETMGNDFRGKPVTSLPMMKGVRDIKDIGLVVEVTGLAGVTEAWIGLVQGPYQTPLTAAYTAVMAPGYYAYTDSGQLKGMLVGVKGAAEMEVLERKPGLGSAIMSAQSWGHILILTLIILGNAGYLLARGRARRERA